jgi:transposase
MMRTRRRFSIEFKREVIERIKSGEVGVTAASRQYELSATAIYRWLDKYEHGKLDNEASEKGALENKIAELERKVGRQAMEIDLLKKLQKINRQAASEQRSKQSKTGQ